MGVTPDLTVDDFEAYVARLDLDEKSSGIRGIGFVRAVQERDVDAAEQQLGDAYNRAVSVTPATPFDEKLIVTYMAPQAYHPSMIGLDKGFEQGRRAALEDARHTREATNSAPR